MSDVWASSLYQSSFGGVDFDCLETQDSWDRALVMHTYARRDGGDGQDMGAEPRETDCRIIFWDRSPIAGENPFTSSQSHLRRFEEFHRATQTGRSQEFVHPLFGSYRAYARSVRAVASAELRNVIMVDLTFVEDSTEPAPLRVRGPLDAGVAAVTVGIGDVELEMAELGFTPPSLLQEILDTVTEWEEDYGTTLSLREVNLQFGSISAKIDLDIRTLGLEGNIANHKLWKAYQRLHYQVGQAAEAFRQSQPAYIEIQLRAPQPLRVVVTDYYPHDDVEGRYQELLRLNEIDDPSLLPAGSVLVAPAPSAGRRASLRRTA